MERRIEVSLSLRKKLARTFGVTMQSVGNALRYDKKRDSDTLKRIRVMALKEGGVPTVSLPECECIHDEVNGTMVQTFRNGAVLTIDKHTGDAEVKDPKGVVRMRKANVMVNEIYVLQEYAAAF